MFTTGHIIWIGISFLLIVGGVALCMRENPPIKKLLKICFVLGLCSEVTKVLSVITIVPIVNPVIEGGQIVYQGIGSFAPYMRMDHMPFELCSLQIPFTGIALFTKNDRLRKQLFALMYPTSIIGGLLGILLAYMVRDHTALSEFFLDPHMYQYFLFHSMVITQGIYLGISKEVDLRFADVRTAILSLVCIDAVSFYLNSICSTPVYIDDELVGLSHGTNFFSSYINPLGLVLTEKWQWLAYLGIRLCIALTCITLIFLPLRKRGRR